MPLPSWAIYESFRHEVADKALYKSTLPVLYFALLYFTTTATTYDDGSNWLTSEWVSNWAKFNVSLNTDHFGDESFHLISYASTNERSICMISSLDWSGFVPVPGTSKKLGEWVSDWVIEWVSNFSTQWGGARETKFGTNVAWGEDDARMSNACTVQRKCAIPHCTMKI